MPKKKARSKGKPKRAPELLAEVDFASLDLRGSIVDKIAAWAAEVEQHLANYYFDSIEIDLGWSAGPTAVGKITIKNKRGQSVPPFGS